MIVNKVVEKDGKWYVESEEGKNLGGPYDSKEAAGKRLKEVEAFKNMERNSHQAITVNLKPPLRKDQMEGRDFLVAPMIMLTEGVHKGSNGPLYYPPSELEKTPVVWNHKPIVVYHPQSNGQAVSACDPDVLTNRKVGLVMNTRFEDGKLKADAWLEEDRLKKVDDRIFQALDDGQMVEISTGLFTDNEKEEGEWKGEKYVAIARNYRPDHLAILPDQKGACSIADGAGLLRNQAGDDPITLSPVERGLLDDYRVVTHEKSHQQIWDDLGKLLPPATDSPDAMPTGRSGWVVDVFDDHFVYEKNGKLFKQHYTKDEEGKVALAGLPVEVIRITQYKVVSDEVLNQEGDLQMEKKKIVDTIIADNSNEFDEDDRDELMAMVEEELVKLKPGEKKVPASNATPAMPDDLTEDEKAQWAEMDDMEKQAFLDARKPKAPPAPAAENKEQTAEEYIANAPEGIRDMLSAGLVAHNAEKVRLVGVITSNEVNPFSKEFLQTKSLEELRGMAVLAAPTEKVKPVPMFGGQGEPARVTGNEKKEEPLLVPVMNFGKEE